MLETYICQLGHGVGFDRHIVLPQLLLDLLDALRDVLGLTQKEEGEVRYPRLTGPWAETDRARAEIEVRLRARISISGETDRTRARAHTRGNHLVLLIVPDPAHQIRQVLVEHPLEVPLHLAECHGRI